MTGTKTCTGCGKDKLLSKFAKNKQQKDGHACACKHCQSVWYNENRDRLSAQKREYYAENREEILARSRRYYAENPDKHTDYHLQKSYGITLADYDAMLKAQGNRCAICGRSPEENGQRLCVDHDHETGENRGLLCGICNLALGGFQDSAEVCWLAMLYLRRYE